MLERAGWLDFGRDHRTQLRRQMLLEMSTEQAIKELEGENKQKWRVGSRACQSVQLLLVLKYLGKWFMKPGGWVTVGAARD